MANHSKELNTAEIAAAVAAALNVVTNPIVPMADRLANAGGSGGPNRRGGRPDPSPGNASRGRGGGRSGRGRGGANAPPRPRGESGQKVQSAPVRSLLAGPDSTDGEIRSQVQYLHALAGMRGLDLGSSVGGVRYTPTTASLGTPAQGQTGAPSAVAESVTSTPAIGEAVASGTGPDPSIGPTGPKKSTVKRKLQRARKAEKERAAGNEPQSLHTVEPHSSGDGGVSPSSLAGVALGLYPTREEVLRHDPEEWALPSPSCKVPTLPADSPSAEQERVDVASSIEPPTVLGGAGDDRSHQMQGGRSVGQVTDTSGKRPLGKYFPSGGQTPEWRRGAPAS